MLRSLGFGLGLETFAKFLMISVSVSKNLVSEKKYRFRFQKLWYRKRSIGFGFRIFGLGIKVSVSVSEKFGIGKKSRYRFRKIWYRKKSLGIGFGQNFGIAIQCCTDRLESGGGYSTKKDKKYSSYQPKLYLKYRES